MARRITYMFLVVPVALLAYVGVALAKSPTAQPTDPSANSPAGVVYQIPLDGARQDAAPHQHVTHPSGAGGSGSGGSSTGGTTGGGNTRSDTSSGGGGSSGSTSGGSSSAGHRGGTATKHAGSGAVATSGSSKTTATLIPGGQPGSLIHSNNGFGSSSKVPGLNGTPVSSLSAVQGNGSSAPVAAIVLAIVVVLAGAAVGARAWSAPRRAQRDSTARPA